MEMLVGNKNEFVGKIAHNNGDFKSKMRKWEPIRFGEVIDCNRFDLWEEIEQASSKTIKKAKNIKVGRAGIFTALLAVGVVATSYASKNIFSKEA